MCLIAFAIQARPGLPLLLAANRDEFFERPTAALHRWSVDGGVEVLAGRDGRDGGTWLGVSTGARVAMLTNVRGRDAGIGARSRGELATRWLQGALDAPAMQNSIDPQAYAGFNLVLGDLHLGHWVWLSNCDPDRPHAGPQPRLHQHTLAPGVYGLSNAALDTPWPKSQALKATLHEVLRSGKADDEALADGDGASLDRLTAALADAAPAASEQLPQTGIDPAREHALSSAFVHLPEAAYGTRSSLVLTVGSVGERARSVTAWEWTHTPQTQGSPHRWDERRRVRETLAL